MQLPFDQSKLDKLLDDHGIDFLIINDKNTAQYLLGGYKFFFFAQKDSIGISRYLPTIGYPKGIFCLIEALNENGFLDNYDSLSTGLSLWSESFIYSVVMGVTQGD